MKKNLTVIIISLISLNLYSQIDSFYSLASKGVVYLSGDFIKTEKLDGKKDYEIYFKDSSGKIHPLLNSASGTGFFVGYQNFLYLVTAQHVAEKLKLNAKLTFNNKNNIPETILLYDIQNGDSLVWYFHDHADVAVLPIHPSSQLNYYRDYTVFDIDTFIDSLMSPKRSDEVISFGFPLSLGVEKNFSPISMSSKTSSSIIDLKRFDRAKISSFFLLDAPSIPGLSGGPVFSLPSWNSKNLADTALKVIAGLVHGVISDNTGGKFAAIVPSKFIIETIKKSKRINGLFTYRYNNGRVWSERLYKDGILLEILSNYDPLGRLQDKGSLRNGNGEVKIYSENGSLLLIEVYKNGRLYMVKKP
jgi:hypothetical protein